MKIAVTVVLLSVATFVGVFAYAKSHNMGFLETAGLFRIRQWGNNGEVDSSSSTLPAAASSSSSSQLLPSTGDGSTSAFTEEEIIAMRQRLSPRELIQVDQKLLPHQFLHLHHMKTGGTSMDGLLQCGVKRLRGGSSNNNNGIALKIPYYNIHECSQGHYKQCRSGKDENCLKSIQEASILSYCAPFSDLPTFQWTIDHDNNNNDNSNNIEGSSSNSSQFSSVTVLRHPVNRVWSMYRFRTKSCYECRTLKEVYEAIDNGDDDEAGMCASQLMNHQTRNLASSSSVNANTTAHELNHVHAQEAISNLQQRITVVGLTEDMESTANIVGRVFPWLAESIATSHVTCPMPRKNTSPSNNGCGPGGSHMPLPDHPDEETARLIEAHNQLDLQVYEAGVKQFELQKVALGLV